MRFGEGIYHSCRHGQCGPCLSCKIDKEEMIKNKWRRRQENTIYNFIRHIIKDNFTYSVPDEREMNKLNIREDDKFTYLKRSKSQEELRKEYFKLAKKYHPDKPSGSTRVFQALTQVYEMLLQKFI